jgi:periplasmic protein TonB
LLPPFQLNKTTMVTQGERKNERIAAITSIGVHAAVFLLLLFMVAWQPPNPPHPEIGIEVNWGVDKQGSDNINPDKEVGSEGPAKEEPKQPEPVEEKQETEQPEIAEEKPAEQAISKTESPVVVKEEVKEVKKPVEKPVEKVEPKKEEPVKKVDDAAVFKSKTQTTDSKSTQPKEGVTGSEGNDTDKKGNKGEPEGTLDAKASYEGKAGGGNNGFGLNMSGWGWSEQPQYKKLTSTLSGKVRFEIEVDEDGQIVKITTLERTLNYEDEKMLRAAIEKSQLEKTSPGAAPPSSKGIVEFTLSLE